MKGFEIHLVVVFFDLTIQPLEIRRWIAIFLSHCDFCLYIPGGNIGLQSFHVCDGFGNVDIFLLGAFRQL